MKRQMRAVMGTMIAGPVRTDDTSSPSTRADGREPDVTVSSRTPDNMGRHSPDDDQTLRYRLNERVKELTAMHAAAFLLRDQALSVPDILTGVADLIPPAFQFTDRAAAEVRYGDKAVRTAGFIPSTASLAADFRTVDGVAGSITVAYLDAERADPDVLFLEEERRLLESLAEMLEATLDRKVAHAALEQSQQRLQLALTAAGMGVWEWEFATNRVIWSAELERIAGLEPGTFGGTLDAYRALVHPDDRDVVAAAGRKAVEHPEHGDAFEAEFRLVRPDGRPRWLMTVGKVLRDENDTAVGMIGTAHDVTGRRELEQQFQQSQKMEAMGRLAGSVAHDFNNILTAIRGYAEFLTDSIPVGDERRADVEQITAAADRAAALTRQLLAFSRRQVVAPQHLDPNAVIRGLRGMMQPLLRSDIETRFALSDTKLAVRIDPGQLEQVVMNLVVNARDAMPAGGVLTIETSIASFDERFRDQRTDLPPGRYVQLAVTDTGAGISPEIRERLFEPFFTTKEKGRGTGLGLATTYGIVKQAGGAIWVYSEPGRGATFKIYLPWDHDREEPEPAWSRTAEMRAVHGSESILLVDDEPQVRELAARTLRGHGYSVVAVSDGEEACRWLERGEPVDVLVTDVVMPRMQGPALAERVRRDRPDVRVLLITGYTERTIDFSLLGAGLLQKPFTPGSLLRAVREMLDS
jgi:PAS domain S-box-containing protein